MTITFYKCMQSQYDVFSNKSDSCAQAEFNLKALAIKLYQFSQQIAFSSVEVVDTVEMLSERYKLELISIQSDIHAKN